MWHVLLFHVLKICLINIKYRRRIFRNNHLLLVDLIGFFFPLLPWYLFADHIIKPQSHSGHDSLMISLCSFAVCCGYPSVYRWSVLCLVCVLCGSMLRAGNQIELYCLLSILPVDNAITIYWIPVVLTETYSRQ